MMAVALGSPVGIDGIQVAALARNSISAHGFARHIAFAGTRRAVALLIGRGDQVVACTPEGETLTPTEVEALCPGAMAKFIMFMPPIDTTG